MSGGASNDPHVIPTDPQVSSNEPIGLHMTMPGRVISWRSVLLGVLGVIGVCGMTPYNDFIINNTSMVGSYLPLVVVLSFFVLIVVVNAPLHRWAPRQALSSGELAIIMLMMLVACAIPSTGMMRYLPGLIVGPFRFGQTDPRFWKIFTGLGLPQWLYPAPLDSSGPSNWVVRDFYGRLLDGSTPYSQWLAPVIGWGVFFIAAMSALVALAVLIRPQWSDNERLAFPIAQLQLALIESPKPGRMFNATFSSRLFWIALVGVFVVHGLNALNIYTNKRVPSFPLSYNLTDIFSEEPWVFLPGLVKAGTIYFTFIGLTYFIQTRTSFSIWFIFLITQLIGMQAKVMGGEITNPAWQDQQFGATIVFVLGVLWIGRHHWTKIFRQVTRGARGQESSRLIRQRRGVVLMLVASVGVMIAWLLVVGVSVWVALLVVFILIVIHLVAGRVVAETGMPSLRIYATSSQIYTNFSPSLMSGTDVAISGVIDVSGSASTREGVFGFALHGLQVLRGTTGGNQSADQETGSDLTGSFRVVGLILGSFVLGYIVAWGSMLACYYHYAVPLDPAAQAGVNVQGTERIPRVFVVDPVLRHASGRWSPQTHYSWLHMGIGAGVTGALQVAALRFAGWPLMPIGYLLSASWFTKLTWFSLFLGWAIKVIVVRFGGATLFRQARPFFIGMILGEMLAASFWMAVTVVYAQLGYDFQIIDFLPS